MLELIGSSSHNPEGHILSDWLLQAWEASKGTLAASSLCFRMRYYSQEVIKCENVCCVANGTL